jgi:asparagine N-glycosylation enzyme membrane subunit Stt3
MIRKYKEKRMHRSSERTLSSLLFWHHWPLVLVIVLACGIQFARFYFLQFDASDAKIWGNPNGPDSFLRLMRVEILYETANWYSSSMPRVNAPYGFNLHWTRLLDIYLLVGGWVGSAFTDFKTALRFWAWVSGPIVQALILFVLYKYCRKFLGCVGFFAASFIFVVQIENSNRMGLGIADHHYLIHLFSLLSIALILRSFGGTPKLGDLFCAGASAAVAVWVSPEALLVAVSGGAVLGCLWVRENNRNANSLMAFAAGLWLTSVIVLAIERPPTEWLLITYDRFSVVHVAIASAGLISAVFITAINHRYQNLPMPSRLGAMAVVGAVCATVLVYGFPAVFKNPLNGIDSELVKIFVKFIVELQSPVPQTLKQIPKFLAEFLPTLIVFCYATYHLIKGRPAQRRRCLFYLIMIFATLSHALDTLRGAGFLSALMVIAWGEVVLVLVVAVRSRWRRREWFVCSGVVGVAMIVLLTNHGGLLSMAFAAGKVRIKSPTICETSQAGKMIGRLSRQGSAQSLHAEHTIGVRLAYWSGLGVIDGLYHTNIKGMEDAYAIWGSVPPDANARRMLTERKTGWVVICTNYIPVIFADIMQNPNSLYHRLWENRAPEWLDSVKMPKQVDDGLRFYLVKNNTH